MIHKELTIGLEKTLLENGVDVEEIVGWHNLKK